MFSSVKNCCVAACLIWLLTPSVAGAQKPAGGENSEAQQWLEQGERAWAEATALDRELKAKAKADADEAEKGKRKKPEQEDADDPAAEDGAVKPDFAGGFALIQKAGEAGHAKAALRVSELLLDGYGVPKDTIGAFEWALKAAELGDVDAQLLTASKFAEGRGTTRSLSRALELYEKAYAQGSDFARMKIAGLLDRGDPGVEQNRARALPLFQEAATAGDREAMYMIGEYLQRGYVVAKDDAAASQWYLRAAEVGEARAQRKLAIRYFRGTGLSQDSLEALKWCELALKNTSADVETKNLAREYRDAIVEGMTPRKVSQAQRDAGRFEVKDFKEITLPPLPYQGPAPVYHVLTDKTGNKLEAAILGTSAEAVKLERRSDGAQFEVPLRRLSDESRKLVEGLAKP